MSERFNKAVRFVLDHETVFKKGHWGDYNYATWENVSGDKGGVTKYGIDQRSHPKLDIKNLTLDQAREIYFNDYWKKSRAEEMPEGYGEVLFDIRVNGGNGPKMLQDALNQCGGNLAVDGILGPKSVAEMNKQGIKGLKSFLKARQRRYDNLARQPKLKKFLQGWTNRNNDLAKFVGVDL